MRALAIAALAVLLLISVVRVVGHRAPLPVPAQVNGRAAVRLHGEGQLLAGAGTAQIQTDRAGGLSARALVLEAGGARVILVALDALLIPGPLEADVLRAAALPPQTCLLLAATHTHAGAGGTWNNLLAEVAGNGVYQAQLARAHRDAAAAAIAQALQGLGPARLRAAREPWPEGPARPRGPGPIDPQLAVLRALRPDGTAVATLVDYAMHPTVVRKNRAFVSGDWPGEAARALEQQTGAPALIVQGAGGNATWAREGSPAAPQAAAQALGERVATHALALASSAPLSAEKVALGCEVRLLALPAARASPAVPRPLRTLASNALALFAEPFAVQTEIELPSLRLFGVPGEVVGDLRPPGDAVPVTLADGYEGYVETQERWSTGGGEAKTTYYGPDLAAALGLAQAR